MEAAKTGANLSIIERDWSCMQCGYNVRGLQESGQCPECGYEVSQSLNNHPLAMADRAWRRRMRLGILLAALGVLIFLFVEQLSARFVIPSIVRLSSWYVLNCGEIWDIVWPLALSPSAWLLRKPEFPSDRATWIGRWLWPPVVTHLGLSLAIPLLMRAAGLGGATGFVFNESLPLAYAVEPLMQVAVIWILLKTLENLAMRIPRRPLLGEIRWFRWAMCAMLFVQAAINATIQIARMNPNNRPGIGEYFVPEYLGHLMDWVSFLLYYALMPVWIYLPIQLLRFQRYMQPMLTQTH